jgi:hypothetical protein
MADITITSSSVLKTSTTVVNHGTAGAAITAGEPVYIDASDSKKIKPAIATAEASAAAVGVALNDAADDQPVSYAIAGNVTYNAGMTVGAVYCVSGNAAGAIAPVADLGSGDYVTVLGIASTTSNLILTPSVSGVAIA